MPADTVWTTWVTTSTTTSTTMYNNNDPEIWAQWNAATNSTTANTVIFNAQNIVAQTTEEMARRRAESERLAARNKTAQDRAWATLEEMLNDEQRLQLRTQRRVIVPVHDYEFHVMADAGASGNIDVVHKGEYVATLCAHPELYPDPHRPRIPQGDVVLAQVLALKADPANFVRTANVHRGTRPVLPDAQVSEPQRVAA